MSLLEWDERFLIGVPSVDYEHRELIGLVNEAYERLNRSGDKWAILDFLGEIYTRVSAHFALEERLMREKRYDRYAEHKTDHERLLDEILDIMDGYEDEKFFSDGQFARALRAWFGDHFQTHDARLHRKLD